MDRFGISGGSNNEGGASVEDGSAAFESEVLAINGRGEIALPEAVLVDVLEGGKSVGIELGGVKTSESNLAIIGTVGNSGKLVRRDGLVDQSLLRERLDGGQDTLVGKGGLGQTHQTIELGGIAGEILRFHKSNAKDVFIQSQASDIDIITDDVPRDLARAVCNVEGLSGVLEAARRLLTKKDVITLRSKWYQNGLRSSKPR